MIDAVLIVSNVLLLIWALVLSNRLRKTESGLHAAVEQIKSSTSAMHTAASALAVENKIRIETTELKVGQQHPR